MLVEDKLQLEMAFPLKAAGKNLAQILLTTFLTRPFILKGALY